MIAIGLMLKVEHKVKHAQNNETPPQEEGLLQKEGVGYLGGSMVVVGLTQFLLQMIQSMMVGHLGTLALSSSAIATSVMGAFGFSILTGLAKALETLLAQANGEYRNIGQTNGSNECRKFGVHTNSAIISLNLVCLPLSLILFYSEKLLTFIGQDPLISLEAGKYARWLIPALFAYATLLAQMRYLMSQSLNVPVIVNSVAHSFLHALLCWVLVFKSGLGYIGGAVALSSSLWITMIIFAFYIKYSSSCEKTCAPLSKEAFKGIIPFFRLGIPATLAFCLGWWSYELPILLAGLLPNPQFETSVLAICLTVAFFNASISAGFGTSTSTRVSKELEAGKPGKARFDVFVLMLVSVILVSIMSVCLFASRNVLGYAYSNEKEVVDYVTEMIPLMCISIIMAGIQGVLSGTAQGCGWLHIDAIVFISSFYLVGIPVAYFLGFHLHWGGKGLWIGLVLSGTFVRIVVLSIIAKCTKCRQKPQAPKAREAYRKIIGGYLPLK